MAPRAYWKGSLKLSLVSCPVLLYPATTQARKTKFHLLNKRTDHRLKQQMVDAESGRAVDDDQKARGYEVSKGEFVEIDKEELEAIQIESTHTIDIDSFVPQSEIDKRYFNRPYYIAPDGKVGLDAFAVIRDAMKDQDRVALARIVLTNREHVMAIEHIRTPKITKDMVALARHILDSKAEHFHPSTFKDSYEEALKALVKRKAAGKPVKVAEVEERPSNVINLMDALKQSLKSRGSTRKPAAKSHARRSPHRRMARRAHRASARHRRAS